MRKIQRKLSMDIKKISKSRMKEWRKERKKEGRINWLRVNKQNKKKETELKKRKQQSSEK